MAVHAGRIRAFGPATAALPDALERRASTEGAMHIDRFPDARGRFPPCHRCAESEKQEAGGNGATGAYFVSAIESALEAARGMAFGGNAPAL